MHLYGSALNGGLKPYSDIDLLVTVTARPDETTLQVLMRDLLNVSAPPRQNKHLRALEVTVVVHDEVMPWRYPVRRALQFGEWLRQDILKGIFEPAVEDPDLALLLTQARQHSIALLGPSAETLFEPVPESDFFKVLADTLKLWNTPSDWAGDERNVLLMLARIWYSAATGKIAPKDLAADWALARLPEKYQPPLIEACQAYLGQAEDRLARHGDQLTELIAVIKDETVRLLEQVK